MIIVEGKKFGGLWQESYCFPSIVKGNLYYCKRSRLVVENLVANEGNNWRLVFCELSATARNDSLPAHRKMSILDTTTKFLGVKNRKGFSLMIEVHMGDPNAALAYQRAMDSYLDSLSRLGYFASMPIVQVMILFYSFVLESWMSLYEEGMEGATDLYIFNWSPGRGDYSLWTVPIYRELKRD